MKEANGSASSLESRKEVQGKWVDHGPIGDIWSQPKRGKRWGSVDLKGSMIGIPVAAVWVVGVDV